MKRALNILEQSQVIEFQVMVASSEHLRFVPEIVELIALSAKERGTGRGKREPDEMIEKINKGQAIIALCAKTQVLAGFCYVESYDEGKFFANSALIVAHDFRGAGLARLIKHHAFNLGQSLFPYATPITITTSTAVMKLNQELGYKAVSFDEISADDQFWKGCEGCVNFNILSRLKRKNCLCTALKGTALKDRSSNTEYSDINSKNSRKKSSKSALKSVRLAYDRSLCD